MGRGRIFEVFGYSIIGNLLGVAGYICQRNVIQNEGTHDAASRRKTVGSYVKDLSIYDEVMFEMKVVWNE